MLFMGELLTKVHVSGRVLPVLIELVSIHICQKVSVVQNPLSNYVQYKMAVTYSSMFCVPHKHWLSNEQFAM